MIRSIFRYRLNLPEFLNDLPSFVRDWCVSRRWRLMFAGSPAVLLSVILFSIFLYRWLDVGRDQLGADYQKLAFAAIEAGQVAKADVYMARTIELARDRSARSF